MNSVESTFRKRFLALVVCGALVLFALAWAMVKGVLSYRGFAITALAWWIAMFAAILLLIQSNRKRMAEYRRQQISQGVSAQAFDRERSLRAIRSFKALIAAMVLGLIFELLQSRNQALLPRLIGAAVNLSITALLVYVVLRMQRKLKQPPDRTDRTSG